MNDLCTFKIILDSQNLEHWFIKDQLPYVSQHQDAKPRSGTSSLHQSPESILEGHGGSLHLQKQEIEQKFEI